MEDRQASELSDQWGEKAGAGHAEREKMFSVLRRVVPDDRGNVAVLSLDGTPALCLLVHDAFIYLHQDAHGATSCSRVPLDNDTRVAADWTETPRFQEGSGQRWTDLNWTLHFASGPVEFVGRRWGSQPEEDEQFMRGLLARVGWHTP